MENNQKMLLINNKETVKDNKDKKDEQKIDKNTKEKNEKMFFSNKPSYWKNLSLVWNSDHSNIKSIPSSYTNHEIMIAEDEYLKDKIKLNELDKLIHFPNKFFVPRQWNEYHDQYVFEGIMSDKHISYIKTYLEQKYLKYKFKPKQDIIIEVLDHIAWDNRYNPIKDYIKYCHQQ